MVLSVCGEPDKTIVVKLYSERLRYDCNIWFAYTEPMASGYFVVYISYKWIDGDIYSLSDWCYCSNEAE